MNYKQKLKEVETFFNNQKPKWTIKEEKFFNANNETVEVYHFREDDNKRYHAIDIIIHGNKLFYTGDFGFYFFGREIFNDVKDFFSGVRINPHYWTEKLYLNERITDKVETFNYFLACMVIQELCNVLSKEKQK